MTPPSGLSYTSPQTYEVGTTIGPLQPSVTGVVTTYSVSPSLPVGLTLNSSTGAITGTPAMAQPSATYTVSAANGGGSTSFGLVIAVAAGSSVPAPSNLSYPSPQTFVVGTTIAPLQPTVTGTVSTFSISPQLPAGLTLNFSTGTITGTPGALSPATVHTVTAANGSGSTSFGLHITVAATAATYSIGGSVSGLPPGTSVELTNNGGDRIQILTDGPFTFPGVLPDGSGYRVEIARQPGSSVLCAPANGAGTVASANVLNVQISCTAPTWKTPTLLQTTGTAATEIAMRSDGSAIVIWRTDSAFRASFYTPADGWSAAQTITTAPDSSDAKVVYDEDGYATVVWRTRGQSDLTWYRHSPDTGWSNGTIPGGAGGSSPNGSNANNPQIAVDGSGRILAVWSRYQHGTNGTGGEIYMLYASRFEGDTGWSTPEPVSDPSASVREFSLALNTNGNAMLAWTRYEPAVDNSEVFARTYSAGGAWGTPTLLESLATPAFYPGVAVDPAGNALVAWTQASSIYRDTYVRRYVAGSGWQAAQIVSDPAMPSDASWVTMKMDSAGNGLLSWIKDDRIQAARYTAGTGWSPPVSIQAPALATQRVVSIPSVSIDGQGVGFVAWPQYDDAGTASRVFANRFVPGTGWETAEQISQSIAAAQVYYPKVVTDRSGRAIVAWYHHPNGQLQSVVVNRFE